MLDNITLLGFQIVIGPVIHQVALGWISSEPPKIEHFHVQNSEFKSSTGRKDQPFSFFVLHFHKKIVIRDVA